jgi:hypothetical protein
VQGKMPDLLVLPSRRILMAVGMEGLADGSDAWRTPDRSSFCTLFYSDDHGQTWTRDIAFQQVEPGTDIMPGDGPGMCSLGNSRVLVIIQAKNWKGKPRPNARPTNWTRGMSLMANVIEPIHKASP